MSKGQNELFGRIAAIDAEAIEPKSFELDCEVCIIGRNESCHISVSLPRVSRLHARIERKGGRYTLIDTGSVNGTYVNQKRISGPHMLSNDDKIGLGQPQPLLRFYDPDQTEIVRDQLHFDNKELCFYVGDRRVEVSPLQLRLLRFLYEHANEVCSRERCVQAVWGHDYRPDTDGSLLDQQIAGVRGALRAACGPGGRELLFTRRGVGYKLDLDGSELL